MLTILAGLTVYGGYEATPTEDIQSGPSDHGSDSTLEFHPLDYAKPGIDQWSEDERSVEDCPACAAKVVGQPAMLEALLSDDITDSEKSTRCNHPCP